MSDVTPPHPLSLNRLILIPSLISLALTILRLIGELQHWSEGWFSTDTTGVIPGSRFSWIIGITWLALPFGVYFALKLAAAGQLPDSVGRAFACLMFGFLIAYGGLFILRPRIPLDFPKILLYIWSVIAVAALLQWFGWRALCKTLLAYGLAARIPVVIVMFLAMLGDWGTHYDYVGMPAEFQMPLAQRFFWLAFFPQLIFWVGFTVLAGSFAGVITVSLYRVFKPAQPAMQA